MAGIVKLWASAREVEDVKLRCERRARSWRLSSREDTRTAIVLCTDWGTVERRIGAGYGDWGASLVLQEAVVKERRRFSSELHCK